MNFDILKEKTTMIDFINAEDGNVEFFAHHTLIGRADNAEDLADILINNDVAATVYGSSSMDFASEYGFDCDEGASQLLDAGVAIWRAASGTMLDEGTSS